MGRVGDDVTSVVAVEEGTSEERRDTPGGDVRVVSEEEVEEMVEVDVVWSADDGDDEEM